ncbi:MAG: CPXCG motif-containing cysteine-rich protein [Myxococcota bacterium]
MGEDTCGIVCPYCFEYLEVYVDPGSEGELVEDCEVCCRPWRLWVERDEHGALRVTVDRAQ